MLSAKQCIMQHFIWVFIVCQEHLLESPVYKDFPWPDLGQNIVPYPSQLKNEQKLPKMVYIIPNFLVLHFGENFMKIPTNLAKLQMHENLHVLIHIFMQVFMSFYDGQLNLQICYSFTFIPYQIFPILMVQVFPPKFNRPLAPLQKGRKIPGILHILNVKNHILGVVVTFMYYLSQIPGFASAAFGGTLNTILSSVLNIIRKA